MKQYEAILDPSMWEITLVMLREQGAKIDRVIVLSDEHIEDDHLVISMSSANIKKLKDGVNDRFVLFKDENREPSGAV